MNYPLWESLVSDKRRRGAEMAASTIAMSVPPKTSAKGGGHNVLLFLIYAFPFKMWWQTEGYPCMEKGINMTFNN